MSVVVAVVNDNKITIAADSGIYSGWSITPVKDVKISKLEKINDMILGGVGYAEEILLFFDYMKTHVLDVVDPEHIRQFIKEFLKYKEELYLEKCLNNEYILAAKGKCYLINGMMVSEIVNSWAIGAGRDYANGALYNGATAEKAVETSIALCAFVGGAIVSETLERKI